MLGITIQLTQRDAEQLRFEYDEAVKAELKIIFYKFENAPEEHYSEIDVGYLKYLLEIIEDAQHLSKSIQI